MDYHIRLHALAEAELDRIYDDINEQAGPVTAGNYVDGIFKLIGSLASFPERGTIRPGPIPNLRIIGFRRTSSIAFVVESDLVTILGVFRRGQNISPEVLQSRV